MRLITTILPRSNDTVIYTALANGKPVQSVTFTRDADTGDLAADVPDDALAGRMLATGNFEPADEADYLRADELLAAAQPKKPRRARDDDDDDDEGDGAILVNGGLPVEAHTPPMVSKKSAQARMGRGTRRMALAG